LDRNWRLHLCVCISAFASSITLIAFLTTWNKILRDDDDKRSLFYLEQIKDYFSNAVTLLADGENNSIKWHQAIESLKTADDLGGLLTVKSHQHIYVTDHLDTAYRIIDVIAGIEDLRFFYGISNYKDRDSLSLYKESNPPSLEKKYSRIAPDALQCLCRFIDKANRAFFDINYNKSRPDNVLKNDYFKASIREDNQLSGFIEPTMKTVINYINDFNSNKIKTANENN